MTNVPKNRKQKTAQKCSDGIEMLKLSMTGHDCPWLAMTGHDWPWLVHDCPWLAMTVHDCPWLAMTVHDCPWLAMTVHDCPWLAMTVHDWPWLALTGHDWPWLAMTGLDWPWLALIMTGHDWPWLAMTVHDWPWLAMTGHDCPWLAMTGRDWPWLSMTGHAYDWPWLAMTGHDWPWLGARGAGNWALFMRRSLNISGMTGCNDSRQHRSAVMVLKCQNSQWMGAMITGSTGVNLQWWSCNAKALLDRVKFRFLRQRASVFSFTFSLDELLPESRVLTFNQANLQQLKETPKLTPVSAFSSLCLRLELCAKCFVSYLPSQCSLLFFTLWFSFSAL